MLAGRQFRPPLVRTSKSPGPAGSSVAQCHTTRPPATCGRRPPGLPRSYARRFSVMRCRKPLIFQGESEQITTVMTRSDQELPRKFPPISTVMSAATETQARARTRSSRSNLHPGAMSSWLERVRRRVQNGHAGAAPGLGRATMDAASRPAPDSGHGPQSGDRLTWPGLWPPRAGPTAPALSP